VTTAEITIAEELCQFIKQYVDDYHCLELFRFFGAYPNARFNELAVVHALNSEWGTSYVKRAIGYLVDKGVVKVSVCNDTPLYSMTEDESLRSLALNLAKLDWSQWQLMLRQTLAVPA
jgi:hypothetical protein